MAYQSIYTGAEIDRRLTDVDSKIPFPSPAYAGLFPMATAQGLVQWVPRGQPTQEQTRQAVEDYLGTHPVPVPSVYALGNAIINNGWNQLINPADYSNKVSVGITFTKGAGTTVTVSGTATGATYLDIQKTVNNNFVAGHKYAVRGMSGATSSTPHLRIRADGDVAARIYNPTIFTAGEYTASYLRLQVPEGYSGSGTYTFQCVDLTDVFGAGNEPGIDQFMQLFPDEYYPYATPGFGDLLWTNASPSTAFAGQDIALDASGYRYALLLYKSYLNQNEQSASLISLNGEWSRVTSEYNGVLRVRRFAKISTGIRIEGGKGINPYGTESADNNGIIPLYLYGR